MQFSVLLTDDTVRDVESIYDHIDLHHGSAKAGHVLDRIEKALNGLSENPDRGAYPEELLALGLREFCQIFFKPYRMIYRVIENKVYVLLTADGRRDMQKLLQRRLLQA
ncbi:MAG: type II toxin-antitoxin system RelE/ParE family toxin [Desulfobacterales bacterium]